MVEPNIGSFRCHLERAQLLFAPQYSSLTPLLKNWPNNNKSGADSSKAKSDSDKDSNKQHYIAYSKNKGNNGKYKSHTKSNK